MDATRFGLFVAEMRKENHMTQAELATKIKVTDKAVSRWERGLGFPDINSLEPLAEALGVSVLELMKSEKIVETNIQCGDADIIVTDTIKAAEHQKQVERQQEKRIILISIGVVAMLSIFALLMDGRKILCKRFSTKSRIALENRANSGLNPLFTESHGGQNGMRAGTA